MQSILIQKIPAADTLPLRQEVLRPGQPVQACIFDLDLAAHSTHFGAFQNHDLVGIASIFREGREEGDSVAEWRIRGMAVSPQLQSRGIGNLLLKECVSFAAIMAADIIWCNARTSALSFYEKQGFLPQGEEFDIPGVGAHIRYVLNFISN